MDEERKIDGERRDGPDRRRRPTRALSRYSFVGRRRAGRRDGERADIYVDRYRPLEWFLVLAMLAMCVADLWLTLDYLEAGGEEWNPLMAMALRSGTTTFVVAKLGLTALGAFVLLVRVRFRHMLGVLSVIALLYVLLLGWHVYLRLHLNEIQAPAAATETLQDEG